VRNAQAALEQAAANVENARLEAERRRKLRNLSTSIEEQQSYATRARIAEAGRNQAAARLDKAKVDLDRTKLVSPVNGYVTNLAVQAGDFATAGQRTLSIVDTDSFWVDGYFEAAPLDRHRRSGAHLADGLSDRPARPRRGHLARHPARQRAGRPGGPRHGQPDLHLDPAGAAGSASSSTASRPT
jgi:hypothetical protein